MAHWLRSLSLTTAAILAMIVVFLVSESWEALIEVGPLRFLLDAAWSPGAMQFGMGPMFVGTLLVALGAIALAGPVGAAVALFALVYAPPWLGRVVTRTVHLLAALPSVVYGLWGLTVLAPWLSQGLACAVVVLASMILPTVTLIYQAHVASLEPPLMASAAALGLGRGAVVWRIVVPLTRGGLLTALTLATARALGETMAVLMVSGNVVQVPDGLTAPLRTLTANIALEMAYAADVHRSALFASGLGLVVLVLVLLGLGRLTGALGRR